jgi:hypothetical protein
MSRADEERAITVWQYLEWRCEYWQGNGASELRLYKGGKLFQLARPLDTFETRSDPRGGTAHCPSQKSDQVWTAASSGGEDDAPKIVPRSKDARSEARSSRAAASVRPTISFDGCAACRG